MYIPFVKLVKFSYLLFATGFLISMNKTLSLSAVDVGPGLAGLIDSAKFSTSTPTSVKHKHKADLMEPGQMTSTSTS